MARNSITLKEPALVRSDQPRLVAVVMGFILLGAGVGLATITGKQQDDTAKAVFQSVVRDLISDRSQVVPRKQPGIVIVGPADTEGVVAA